MNSKTKLQQSRKRNGISSIVIIAVIVAVIAVAGGGIFFAAGHMGNASGGGGIYGGGPYGQGVPTVMSHTTSAAASSTSSSSAAAASSTSSKSPNSIQVSIVSGAHIATQAQHFVPDTITVEIGVNNTVVWVNQDSTTHTVTANNGAFDSGSLASGSSFKFTFTTPGTYQYHCNIHPFMTGTVIVLGSNGQSGASSSTTASSSTPKSSGW